MSLKKPTLFLITAGLALAAAGFAEGSLEHATLGKSALENKDYDQAREQFETGLRVARETADIDAEIRFLFYRGLTEQADGEATGDEATLVRAAGYYRRVLALKPDSGSSMVNLAKVFHRLGQSKVSIGLYRRAIGLDDERRPAYEESYADFLQSIGRGDEAIALYQHLVREDPQNATAQQALSDYYLNSGREWRELESYLWEQVRAGEVDRVLDAALEALGNRQSARERTSLLTVIAAALSRQFNAPESFLESSTAESLRGFFDDLNIGAGVKQLLSVYDALIDNRSGKWQEGNPYEALDFSWWTRGDSRRDPEVGLYPRDAFRRLMRSLGDRYAQRKEFLIAEACYETAATFTTDELDPAAIRDLVNLYGRTGEIGKIEELAAKFEFVLFEAKGQAYRNSQLEKIYQYHQTLGQIYGYLAEKTGDWGNSSKPNSAIFQLEHAIDIGKRLDRAQVPLAIGSGDRERRENHLDPGLVHRLARAYDATGNKTRGDNLRLQAAELYERVGDQRAKTYVLRPMERTALKPAQRQRYLKLVAPKTELQVQPQIERQINPQMKESNSGKR